MHENLYRFENSNAQMRDHTLTLHLSLWLIPLARGGNAQFVFILVQQIYMLMQCNILMPNTDRAND